MAGGITTEAVQSTAHTVEVLEENKSLSLDSGICSKSKSKSQERRLLKSQKSASHLKHRRYRLYRTLKRSPRFEDFTENDLKYIYASYKLTGGDIEPEEFHKITLEEIDTSYDYAWTLKALHKDKLSPVGVIFGIENNGVINIVNVIWFKWATLRNKLESILKFLSIIRKKYLMTMNVPQEQKKFMLHLCHYGMLHRVGSLLDIYQEPSPLFQTRYKKVHHGITK